LGTHFREAPLRLISPARDWGLRRSFLAAPTPATAVRADSDLVIGIWSLVIPPSNGDYLAIKR
jgi:hypothetical protein